MDIFVPSRCTFCRRKLPAGKTGICDECRSSLPYREPQCTDGDGYLDMVCAPLKYEGNVRSAISRYKFSGFTSYARPFGELVAGCVRENIPNGYDLISWVPLSSERLAERGYDQAMLIALSAALELGDVAVETLRRTRHSSPQSGTQDAASRRANVSGAYEIIDAELVRGKRVLLIDDIITTGSTAGECAHMLRDAGAVGVICATLAR